MKAQVTTPHLYNVTVSGVTATMPGPDDIVEMYRTMRAVYPREISVEIRPVDEDVRVSNKVDWHHGEH